MLNIDWNKIKTECPKGFEMFYTELDLWLAPSKQLIYRELYNDESPCFCDIVDFFDGQGIIIISDFRYGKYNSIRYYYRLYPKNQSAFNLMWTLKQSDKKEARTEAVYKAFQIYEERLK